MSKQEIILAGEAARVEAERDQIASFVDRITFAHHKSVEAVFETGRLLIEAKANLPHGAFGKMIASDLPFGRQTAAKLMAIALDARLTNDARVRQLPPSWGTLYELTKLDDEVLEQRFADKTIRPDMMRRDISVQVKKLARTSREQELATKQKALPTQKFGVIYADPAWKFVTYSDDTGMDRAADNHYPTMALSDIKSMPVDEIAHNDCVLFMWVTGPHLANAFKVLEAWGFAYKARHVWHKEKAGTGYWNRDNAEELIIATRGKVPCPAMGEQFEAAHLLRVGDHSAKPEFYAEMIEGYFPNLDKIELNRRGAPRPGWFAWGNEVEGADESGLAYVPIVAEVVEVRAATYAQLLAAYQRPIGAFSWDESSILILKAGYAEGIAKGVIAHDVGCKPGSLFSKANRLGLTDKAKQGARTDLADNLKMEKAR